MIYLAFFFFCFLAFLSWMWGEHMEYMDKKHPDLKNNKPNDKGTGSKNN